MQGFRYWKDPGLFNQYRHDGPLGRFEGYVQAVIGGKCLLLLLPNVADLPLPSRLYYRWVSYADSMVTPSESALQPRIHFNGRRRSY